MPLLSRIGPAFLTFKRQHHKIVKHTQTIRQQQPANCLSVFDHCLGLAFKGLILTNDNQN